jgi:two-component sensor histidine kinase
MRRGRILEILYHPAFISLIVWIVLIIFIPLPVSKYSLRTISQDFYPQHNYFFYCDLDSDGSSEKISLDLNDPGQTKVIIYKEAKVMDQYNVAYHPSNIQSVYFGDYNNDACKEIYIFTISDTTLFVSILDPIGRRNAVVYNRVIDYWNKPSQSTDKPNFVPVGMTVNSDLSTKDLVFYVNTGYSVQPRNLYRYIITSDSLIKSPESFATISQCIMIDKPGDPDKYSFLLSTQATGNVNEAAPFCDMFSWFMILNDDMDFVFSPVKTGEYPSRLVAIPIKDRETTMYVVFHEYFGTADLKSMFYLYDENGDRVNEMETVDFEPIFANIFPGEDGNAKSFYFLRNSDGMVEQIDAAFNTVHTYKLPALEYCHPISCIDADLDGHDEYIFLGKGDESLVICQTDFKDATDCQLNAGGSNFIISQVISPGHKPLIHIQLERQGWLLSYEKNPFYYLRFPILFVSYLILFLFISAIYRIQKHRLDLKLATEREIASLQMRAIKNQIDPHFTLNVLNSIGSLYLNEANRQKADYIFGKYAKLIRQTVISSDKIVITLEEEIDFIRNYLDIECFRLDNSFKYSIDIDSGVDMELKIPRTLIHTFVENSVKYGLRKRDEGGILTLEIRQDRDLVSIAIEDNGPGLITDGKSSPGTGKGLLIIKELTDLYYRLERVRITTSLENIEQLDNSVAGTRANILLPYQKS